MFITKKSSNLRKYGTSQARINNVVPMNMQTKTVETAKTEEPVAAKVCKPNKKNNNNNNIEIINEDKQQINGND